MKHITKKALKTYLKDPFHCPFCGAMFIEARPFDGETNTRMVICCDCGEVWCEQYELMDITSGRNK